MVFAWVIITVPSANSLMMRQTRSNIIVMLVVFAELVVVKTFFIAIVVVHVIATHFRTDILAWRIPCTRIVLYV